MTAETGHLLAVIYNAIGWICLSTAEPNISKGNFAELRAHHPLFKTSSRLFLRDLSVLKTLIVLVCSAWFIVSLVQSIPFFPAVLCLDKTAFETKIALFVNYLRNCHSSLSESWSPVYRLFASPLPTTRSEIPVHPTPDHSS